MSRPLALFVLTCIVLVCTYAVADSVCQSMVVAALPGTTCTVGDKTFQFLPLTPTPGTSVVASQITFTPYLGSPLGPGFTLTFPDTLFVAANGNTIGLQLNFAVSITDPTSTDRITGTTLTLNGFSVTFHRFQGGFADVAGVADLSAQAPNCGDAFAHTGFNSVAQMSWGTTASASFSCGATLVAGKLILHVDAGGAEGFASLTGPVTLVIDEQTPEPSSLILLGSGILALAAYCKRLTK